MNKLFFCIVLASFPKFLSRVDSISTINSLLLALVVTVQYNPTMTN